MLRPSVLWHIFWSDDSADWGGAPVPWRWTARIILLAIAAGLIALAVPRVVHAQGPDSAKVEGLSVRFAWNSLAGADSARLTITDLKTAKVYFNSKVSTRTKTRAVTIPVRIDNGLTSYREVRRILAVTRQGVTTVDTILFPRVASVVIVPPPDTTSTPPPDTAVVVTPPAGYVPEPSTIAELPREWIDTRMPAITRTVPVTCSTLQSALNNAQDGDALTLPAGSFCTGHFTYSGRHPADTPVILTTGTALPPEGTRMTPAAAGPLAVLETNSSQPALEVKAFASGLRVVGIAFRAAPQTKLTYYLANLGPVVRSVDSMAHDITLDRVYMQGHDSLQLQRCVGANAVRVAVIDSWLAGCHMKGSDAQAIIAWNSPGPIKVVNNHLEGSGENFMLGGADPAITGLIASDIEFRRNHVIKPLAWQDSAGFNPWTEKNLFELKSARRVLVEGNVFENNWTDGQAGLALVLKSANQSGHCDWCGTSDVIFRWNVLKNSPGGFSITRGEAYNGGTYDPQHDIDINHVLFDSVGTTGQQPFDARRLLQLGGIRNLSIRNLTAVSPMDSSYIALMILQPTDSAVFADNLLSSGRYGVTCAGKGYGSTAVTNCWLGGTFSGNAWVGKTTGVTNPMPTGNTYPATLPYTGTAGADRDELAKRLQGVATP